MTVAEVGWIDVAPPVTAVGGSSVITPSRSPLYCVNQMRPSGPVAMPLGLPFPVIPCV